MGYFAGGGVRADACAYKSQFESTGDLKMMDGDGSNSSVQGRRQKYKLQLDSSSFLFLTHSNHLILVSLAHRT